MPVAIEVDRVLSAQARWGVRATLGVVETSPTHSPEERRMAKKVVLARVVLGPVEFEGETSDPIDRRAMSPSAELGTTALDTVFGFVAAKAAAHEELPDIPHTVPVLQEETQARIAAHHRLSTAMASV